MKEREDGRDKWEIIKIGVEGWIGDEEKMEDERD